MVDTPQILIVDDHPLFRDALESALYLAFPDGARAIHARDMASAKASLDPQMPDMILLDLNLPDANGFEGLQSLKVKVPDRPIVVVSATESSEAFQMARALGAAGYMPKSIELDEMSAVLVTILDGGEWFPEAADTQSSDMSELTVRINSLTPAQRRVLAGLSDGLLNKQIAFDMGISTATVKAHMTAIFRKLRANNRTQALLIYKTAMQISDHSVA